MTLPPPPPPVTFPADPVTTAGCHPGAPICIAIPDPIPPTDTRAGPWGPPTLIEVRPRKIGGFQAGDLVAGIAVPDEALWAIWRHLPPTEQEMALWVARFESGFDPTAVSTTHDVGPWQHHERFIPARLAAIGEPTGDPTDWDTAARMTAWLVDTAGGWWPWATADLARSHTTDNLGG